MSSDHAQPSDTEPVTLDHFGPLAALIGEWEGSEGTDVSFHHADDEIGTTSYREVATFKPFGPVDNGSQHLYGLDYKMAAWRHGEDDPFHTEVGYLLWCPMIGHVMKGFVIPRGSTILAGGPAEPDATEFTIRAESGDPTYGISSNPYLEEKARCTSFTHTLKVEGDVMTYEQNAVLELADLDEPMDHTDGNTLRRVATFDLPT